MFPLVLSGGESDDQPQRVVFLKRPRRLVSQAVVVFAIGVGSIVVLKDTVDMLTLTDSPLGGNGWLFAILVWTPYVICAFLCAVFLGWVISVHNVTVLGNMLRAANTEEKFLLGSDSEGYHRRPT